MTSEIRQVNMGFNRMARELAKVEQDRAVMLAGISHDLRTPLARLRLEAEMSVPRRGGARANMAMDIDQLDAIIDKFMDYARPGEVELDAGRRWRRSSSARPRPSATPARSASQSKVAPDTARAGRRRRARPRVRKPVRERAPLRPLDRHRHRPRRRQLRAHRAVGDRHRARPRPGRRPKKLDQLTTPFFRGDAARTAATGAGLGLAIVEKSVQRMGGAFEMANATEGGLLAHVRLRKA